MNNIKDKRHEDLEIIKQLWNESATPNSATGSGYNPKQQVLAEAGRRIRTLDENEDTKLTLDVKLSGTPTELVEALHMTPRNRSTDEIILCEAARFSVGALPEGNYLLRLTATRQGDNKTGIVNVSLLITPAQL